MARVRQGKLPSRKGETAGRSRRRTTGVAPAGPASEGSAARALQLQKTVGNSATAALLRQESAARRGNESASASGRVGDLGSAAVQRDDKGSDTGAAGPPEDWAAQRDEMEGIRARAASRQLQADAVAGLGSTVLSSLRSHLEGASKVYGEAYERYKGKVEAAKEAAKTEEEWIEIGVSILLAIGLATGVGAAAEGLAIEGGLAVEAVKEGIVSVSTEAIKLGAKSQTGLLEIVGSKMEPGGLTPSVMKLQLWDNMVKLHENVLQTIAASGGLGMVASGAEYAIGEMKAQMGGGAGADMSVSDLHSLIGVLANDDGQAQPLDTKLAQAMQLLQDIQTKLESAASPEGREDEMEKDIWLMWMAELPDGEAKVLDIDAIENRLEGLGLITSYYGSGGLLGVDTGIYTTEGDCKKMIAAAKGKAEGLKAQCGSV